MNSSLDSLANFVTNNLLPFLLYSGVNTIFNLALLFACWMLMQRVRTSGAKMLFGAQLLIAVLSVIQAFIYFITSALDLIPWNIYRYIGYFFQFIRIIGYVIFVIGMFKLSREYKSGN